MFDGKYVFISTKDGRKYSGKILKIEEDCILLLDKFSKNVYLIKSNIANIEEQRYHG